VAFAVVAMSDFSRVLGKLDQPVKAVRIGSDDMEDHLCEQLCIGSTGATRDAV